MPAPPELVELQRLFADALREERPLGDDPALAAAVAAHVAGSARLSPIEQADLYREQYQLRHHDALREDYPGVAAIVGEQVFEDLAAAYLRACPPRAPSLRDLGDRIVEFAEGWGGLAADVRGPALAMLRYERAMVDVFDGAEPEPLDAAKLAAMTEEAWDTARLVTSPLLHLFRFELPLHAHRVAVRAALEAGEPPPPLPPPRRCFVALFRQGLEVSYDELDPAAFALLELLRAGEPLPRACERVAAGLDEASAAAFGEAIGPWFQRWTAGRWIIDVLG